MSETTIVHRTFRCTRNVPYVNPDVPGHADPRQRQGHYVRTISADFDAARREACAFMAEQYRGDIDKIRTTPYECFDLECWTVDLWDGPYYDGTRFIEGVKFIMKEVQS